MCDHQEGCDCFDWKNIGRVAALADEISDEEFERKRLLEEVQPEEEEEENFEI
jgi:hypothetical protein